MKEFKNHLQWIVITAVQLLIGQACAFQITQNSVGGRLHRPVDGAIRTSLYMAKESLVSEPPSPTKTRVVVVGGGVGGLSTAFDAKHYLHDHKNHQDVEVTVVSNREQFQFTPSNPWVATGKREPHEISLSLTKVLPKHSMEFVYGAVEKLDPEEQCLTIRLGQSEEGEDTPNVQTLNYDYLVIATGPRLGYEEISGAVLNKNVFSICTTPHASETLHKFRQAFDKNRDNSSLQPHQSSSGVVVGATQGASCFGPAYEYVFMVHHELEKIYGKGKTPPVTLVTSEPYVGHLGLGGAGNSEQVLTQLLKKHNITSYTNCQIANVEEDAVHVEQIGIDGSVSRRVSIPSQFNVLIPPFRGMEVWKRVPGLTDEYGMIRVNEFQQSTEYSNIFGVGICIRYPETVTNAVHMDDARLPIGIPKTGYAIESMGTAAVHNIQQLMLQEKPKMQENAKSNHGTDGIDSFVEPTLNGLCITDFGHRGEGAVFVTVPQFSRKRTYDVTIQGRVATMAKLAFEKYFLYKIDHGDTDPYYEKYLLELVGIGRVAKPRHLNKIPAVRARK